MSARFKANPQGAFRGGGLDNFHRAHLALDAQIIKDTDKFAPFKTGMLASSPLRTRGSVGKITYKTPYARRLYYGLDFKFSRAFHPRAGAQWFEVAKAVYLRRWNELVKRILKGK